MEVLLAGPYRTLASIPSSSLSTTSFFFAGRLTPTKSLIVLFVKHLLMSRKVYEEISRGIWPFSCKYVVYSDRVRIQSPLRVYWFDIPYDVVDTLFIYRLPNSISSAQEHSFWRIQVRRTDRRKLVKDGT